MAKFLKPALLALTALLVFNSCADDDDNGNQIDPDFSVTVADTTFSETGGTLVFNISTPVADGDEVYNYSLDGTATSGDDYVVPQSLSFTVPSGEDNAEVTFEITDDVEVEEDETIIFTLIERNGAPIPASNDVTVTVTIADNDTFPFQGGFLVTNQGPFNNGFGTVSYLDADFSRVENDIYQTVNNDNLGNIVQSIGFNGGDAYVIANVSNRITVVDRYTFEEKARIETGLENPRFFAAVNGKGYVTNWGDPFVDTDDYIAVIDLSSQTVTAQIPVALGPEKIIFNGTNLYVAHKGAFSTNNIVSVIDPTSDTVTGTIAVGDRPNSMELDSQGSLWVLNGGEPAFTGNETGGLLVRINPDTNTVVENYPFAVTEHPDYLNIENDTVYYYNAGGLFQGSALDFGIPNAATIDGLSWFNMEIVNGSAIGANAGDFASNGMLEIYNLTTNSVTATFDVGIIPENIYLNE